MATTAVIAPTRIKQINNLYGKIGSGFREMVEVMIKLGDLLSQVKNDLPHGTFMQWVKDNCEFSHRTATSYMTLHENKDWVMQKILEFGNDATMTGILALMPKQSDSHDDKPDNDTSSNIVIRKTRYGAIWQLNRFQEQFKVKAQLSIAGIDARIANDGKTDCVAIFPGKGEEVHVFDWEFIKRLTGKEML